MFFCQWSTPMFALRRAARTPKYHRYAHWHTSVMPNEVLRMLDPILRKPDAIVVDGTFGGVLPCCVLFNLVFRWRTHKFDVG